MRLVKASGENKGSVRRDALEQLRDVGARLEYVLARYSHLVAELREGAHLTELSSRLDLVNSQLVYVTRRLQEVFLLEYEGEAAEAMAGADAVDAENVDFSRVASASA